MSVHKCKRIGTSQMYHLNTDLLQKKERKNLHERYYIRKPFDEL